VIPAIELATDLVRQAPDLVRATVDELHAALARDGSPLALAIARIVELVDEQLVDPGVALPAIAEACATLETSDPRAREAARYRIDTLQPVPDRPVVAVPDVDPSMLRRRS
jgi:hypothetical protein